MDCEVIKNNFSVYTDVFDGYLEEKVDLDIIIPDYCAAAIKILNCDLTPIITSTVIESDRFIVEGVCTANVMYIDEQSGMVKSIEESTPFTRVSPLDNNLENNRIKIKLRTSNVICRLLNSRRISVKTVVGLAVKISGNKHCELTTDFDNCNIETKNKLFSGNIYVNSACSNMQIGSELHTQSPVCEIIKTSSNIFLNDIKVIPGKVILKGNSKFECLYTTDDEKCSLQCESINVPFSEVVEVEGVEEGDICNVDFGNFIVGCSLDNSSHNIINFELEGMCFLSAYTQKQFSFVIDAYSKKNCVILNTEKIDIEYLAENVKSDFNIDDRIEVGDVDCAVKSVWTKSNIRNINHCDGGAIIEGDVEIQFLLYNNDEYKIIEKNIPYEKQIKFNSDDDDRIRCEADVVCNATDVMFDGQCISFKCEVSLFASLFLSKTIDCVNNVEITEEIPNGILGSKVVLYYAQKGESVWEIAKKYCTSVEIIKRDNNIVDEYISEDIMLFVSSN